ncbi:MAG: UDP-N-acetylglucosamine 1-carboxyvinyltransferase [Lachnospiraceae bacterium]|nr:UDP-N-acetylglucosamine 1-carboxyvinyltransferase [Lachnospiraceae bacterium]
MDSIPVKGGISLQGKVRSQGSNNAALPILAACLVMKEPVVLENCPKITDVYEMIRLLESLGCCARWEGNTVRILPGKKKNDALPPDAAMGMRSSVLLLGALLARDGEVSLPYPGGCVIGKRPVDLHIAAFRKMSVVFEEKPDGLFAHISKKLTGAEVALEFPSVGATENLLLAGVLAEGETVIRGAAREPEVQNLCRFLEKCGAKIRGIGTNLLVIEGQKELVGGSFCLPSDRIVAGTYLLAGFMTGGEFFLERAPVKEMEAVLKTAEQMGADIWPAEEGIYAQFPERPGPLPYLQTAVYPGFPTDLQSVLLAVRCIGKGCTLIRETIFENRFRLADDLESMGAELLRRDEWCMGVFGVGYLTGTKVEAKELRGGAALTVAALGAEGETIITGKHYIDRGYENICRDLKDLGARIVSD